MECGRRMKYERITAGLLAMSLLFGGIGTFPVAAVQELRAMTSAVSIGKTAESEAMKQALLDVKSRVTIPAEYSDFEYTVNTNYGIPQYSFYWRDLSDANNPKWSSPTICVSYVNGLITAYSFSDGTHDTYVGFGKLSENSLKSAVLKYFKQLNPKLSGTIEVEAVSAMSLVGNAAYFTISRKEQGIAVDENVAYIGVDKNTGQLISADISWFIGATFDDTSKRVSVETANAAYRAETGLKAEYELFTTYEYDDVARKYNVNYNVKAVYTPENSQRNEIDAITGKYTAYYDDVEKYEKTYAYGWGSGSTLNATRGITFDGAVETGVKGTTSALTAAETQAIADESRFVTQEQVNKIVASDPYIKTEKGMVVKSRRVNERTTSSDTEYELRTVYVLDTDINNITLSVTMDALTGQITSFSKNYGSKTYDTNKVSEAVAKAKTAELAKHFMGSKADGYVFNKYNSNYSEEVETTYIRVVNGINAPFDTVTTTIAPDGEVLEFSYTYHDIAFPKGTLIGENKAYERLLNNYPATLKYTGFIDLQLTPHTYLTYVYPETFILNAFTGERLGYNGEPYDMAEEQEYLTVQYQDIAGHKYEKEIQRCVDYGIYATLDSNLNPDEAITVEEWGMMLCALSRGVPLPARYTDEEYMTAAVEILNDCGWGIDEKNYKAVLNSKLTNKDMVKFFVLLCGNFEYLAEQSIFESPYTDVSKTDPYCGYIAIAKAYGLTKDDNEMFYPDKELTKADCYKLMYDWLSSGKTDAGFKLVCGVFGL